MVLAADLADRVGKASASLHHFGACGLAAGKPLSGEGVAAALGGTEAAGKPAVLLVCPAEAESLAAEVAALEVAHAALKAWGKPHMVLYASQPVRNLGPYCVTSRHVATNVALKAWGKSHVVLHALQPASLIQFRNL